MRAPSPPANEGERLAALARFAILDTEPELPYDEVVQLAAHICEVPIALISLVDDSRQWFKARFGLEAPQTPRDVSFCGHVVEQGAMLEVPDALADPRFADNPLVVGGPRVIFYAGAPLETDEGLTLGTLCVIDHQPRTLSDKQRDMLRALSRLVMRQLESRALERAREQAVREAVTAQRQRQRFFEVSLDMLCIANAKGYFAELNPAWTATLGWSREELTAKPFIEFVHPDDRERTILETAALLGGEHITINFENRYLNSAGEYRWLAWKSAYDHDSKAILAVARDVTDSKNHERELVAARQAAEDANQAKSDFLAKMSHELRTPLNSVIGFTNLLRRNKKGTFDAQDLTWLDKIGKNGVHLLSLINDLLDLSKIEAGHAEISLVPIDLATLANAIRDELEGAVEIAGNHLHVNVPPELAPLRADPRRLKQILINLIGNANKFSKQGNIELRVVADGDRVIRIDVVDDGIGIPAAQREQVFEAFRQVSEGDARTHGGTGLGLAISRSLARLHGFELDLASVEGQGSTFCLKIDPTSPTPEHRPPQPSGAAIPRTLATPTPIVARPAAPGSRTVLVIEDDSDALLLASKAIEQVGARVVSADSGASGFAIAQAIIPDLIVLDLGLPDMHGRDVVRRLSTDPKLHHIPVVIYSGQADAAAGLASASVLEKPVTLDDIARTVAETLGNKRKVLVVDDDADTREVLCSMLHGLGVETYEAGDGVEALEVLRQVGVDLVLLDICMPNMTGFEFLTALRADPKFVDLPVVVCTALDFAPSEQAQVSTVAQSVIRKGFNLEGRLEEIVHEMIRRSHIPPPQPPPEPPPEPPPQDKP